MSKENLKIAFELFRRKLSHLEAATLHKMSPVIDCWVLGKFINMTCTESATAFMNAQSEKLVTAQSYLPRRVIFPYSERNFQAVRVKDISEHYQAALDAI